MKRGPVLRPYRPSAYVCTRVQDAKYACACPRDASVTRPAVRPSRVLSLSTSFFFFFRLPFLSRGCEPSAPGHPSWILMDGDSRTRGRIPADTDPQEGRMRAEKIAAWGGINFRLPFLPALLPSFPRAASLETCLLGVNVCVVVAEAAL